MNITFEFRGGDAIVRALQRMSESVRREASYAALLAAAQPVADHARALCRRGVRGDPHLADNIHVRALPIRGGGDTAEVTVAIGPPKQFYYDLFLEYGTRRSRAFPFYRPALDAEIPTALVICSGAYWRAIIGAGGPAPEGIAGGEEATA
jgi:HK97 gp10 family phage protein